MKIYHFVNLKKREKWGQALITLIVSEKKVGSGFGVWFFGVRPYQDFKMLCSILAV